MSIQVASAPVSWGIYEFTDIAPTFHYTQVLDEIAATGYRGIELGPYGYLPTEPDALREALAQRDLKLLSAFVPVRLVDETAHETGLTAALQVARLLAALDAHYLVLADDNGQVPALTQQAGRRTGSALDAGAWDVFAKGVNDIAQHVYDATGLQTVFHHHCAGYVETADETRELLSRTTPDLVGLCLDTGHWHYAGGDAVACIQEFGERIRYLHLKDCEPTIAQRCREEAKDYFEAVAAGVFCELGQGEVDFPAVLQAMQAQGYKGWAVVEQDILVDDPQLPQRISQANRAYLAAIGF